MSTTADQEIATRRPVGARWDEILDAAAAEFREHGYEGASIRGIAERVGMLKGSLYNYIKGKSDLFVAVVERPARQIIDEAEKLVELDEPVAIKLRRLMEVQIHLFRTHYPTPFVYLAQANKHLDPRFDDWDETYVSLLQEMLQTGVDSGELRADLNVELVSRAILGLMAWMLAWYEPRTEEFDELIIEQFWQFTISGIAKQQPPPRSAARSARRKS